ncbi:MAG: hypothetical protein F6K17_14635 [Okeania sp. SIO3C4]|nr:hypothetical protein [Okeania sp. SIO3B3]NER03765.1 hypothetical protein [Okeania sp. SIO3C4]
MTREQDAPTILVTKIMTMHHFFIPNELQQLLSLGGTKFYCSREHRSWE